MEGSFDVTVDEAITGSLMNEESHGQETIVQDSHLKTGSSVNVETALTALSVAAVASGKLFLNILFNYY